LSKEHYYLFAPVIRVKSWLSLVSHGGSPISSIAIRRGKCYVELEEVRFPDVGIRFLLGISSFFFSGEATLQSIGPFLVQGRNFDDPPLKIDVGE
jgi:hypothetical protein